MVTFRFVVAAKGNDTLDFLARLVVVTGLQPVVVAASVFSNLFELRIQAREPEEASFDGPFLLRFQVDHVFEKDQRTFDQVVLPILLQGYSHGFDDGPQSFHNVQLVRQRINAGLE